MISVMLISEPCFLVRQSESPAGYLMSQTHMKEVAKSCSIPPSEYRHMENGKLIKSKAGTHLNKICTKYRQVLMSANI